MRDEQGDCVSANGGSVLCACEDTGSKAEAEQRNVTQESKEFASADGDGLLSGIALPTGPVQFLLGTTSKSWRKVAWSGQGELPRDVMEYVRRSGVLPPYGLA